MKTVITHHALDHWTGRCDQEWLGLERTRLELKSVVENGRMATRLEAHCLSLYLVHANSWRLYGHLATLNLPEHEVIVSECGTFIFALDCDGEPVKVTTVAMRDDVLRYGRGVWGSRYQEWAEEEATVTA